MGMNRTKKKYLNGRRCKNTNILKRKCGGVSIKRHISISRKKNYKNVAKNVSAKSILYANMFGGVREPKHTPKADAPAPAAKTPAQGAAAAAAKTPVPGTAAAASAAAKTPAPGTAAEAAKLGNATTKAAAGTAAEAATKTPATETTAAAPRTAILSLTTLGKRSAEYVEFLKANPQLLQQKLAQGRIVMNATEIAAAKKSAELNKKMDAKRRKAKIIEEEIEKKRNKKTSGFRKMFGAIGLRKKGAAELAEKRANRIEGKLSRTVKLEFKAFKDNLYSSVDTIRGQCLELHKYNAELRKTTDPIARAKLEEQINDTKSKILGNEENIKKFVSFSSRKDELLVKLVGGVSLTAGEKKELRLLERYLEPIDGILENKKSKTINNSNSGSVKSTGANNTSVMRTGNSYGPGAYRGRPISAFGMEISNKVEEIKNTMPFVINNYYLGSSKPGESSSASASTSANSFVNEVIRKEDAKPGNVNNFHLSTSSTSTSINAMTTLFNVGVNPSAGVKPPATSTVTEPPKTVVNTGTGTEPPKTVVNTGTGTEPPKTVVNTGTGTEPQPTEKRNMETQTNNPVTNSANPTTRRTVNLHNRLNPFITNPSATTTNPSATATAAATAAATASNTTKPNANNRTARRATLNKTTISQLLPRQGQDINLQLPNVSYDKKHRGNIKKKLDEFSKKNLGDMISEIGNLKDKEDIKIEDILPSAVAALLIFKTIRKQSQKEVADIPAQIKEGIRQAVVKALNININVNDKTNDTKFLEMITNYKDSLTASEKVDITTIEAVYKQLTGITEISSRTSASVASTA